MSGTDDVTSLKKRDQRTDPDQPDPQDETRKDRGRSEIRARRHQGVARKPVRNRAAAVTRLERICRRVVKQDKFPLQTYENRASQFPNTVAMHYVTNAAWRDLLIELARLEHQRTGDR